MNNDDYQPNYVHGEEDDVMETETMNSDEIEAFDRFIIRAFVRAATLSLIEDIDSEVVLTDEQRKAMAALGTSKELIDRLLSRTQDRRAMSLASSETSLANSPLAGTAHIGQHSPVEMAVNFLT